MNDDILTLEEVNALLDGICNDTPAFCNAVIKTDMMGDLLAALPYLKAYALTHDIHLYISHDSRVKNRFIHFLDTEVETWFTVVDAPHPDYPIKMVGVSEMARQLGIGGVIAHAFDGVTPRPVTFKSLPRLSAMAPYPRYALLSPFASERIKEIPYRDWNPVIQKLISHGITPVVLGSQGAGHRIWKDCVYPDTWTAPLALLSLVQHGLFHIGLSSGNSWLAHVNGVPTIRVNGFSDEYLEFTPTFQVAHDDGCRNCWNRSPQQSCAHRACMQGHGPTIAEQAEWMMRLISQDVVPCSLFGEEDGHLLQWRQWLEARYAYRINFKLFTLHEQDSTLIDIAALTRFMQDSMNREYDNSYHERLFALTFAP